MRTRVRQKTLIRRSGLRPRNKPATIAAKKQPVPVAESQLKSAAQVFPHIAFFQGANPGHGLLIASSSPLQPDYARIAAFDEDAKINQDLQLMGLPSMWSLLGELVLYDHSYQQAISSLPAMTGLPRDFSSTDLRPYLEYQVPKGITLSYDTVKPNSEFLQRFRNRFISSGARHHQSAI